MQAAAAPGHACAPAGWRPACARVGHVWRVGRVRWRRQSETQPWRPAGSGGTLLRWAQRGMWLSGMAGKSRLSAAFPATMPDGHSPQRCFLTALPVVSWIRRSPRRGGKRPPTLFICCATNLLLADWSRGRGRGRPRGPEVQQGPKGCPAGTRLMPSANRPDARLHRDQARVRRAGAQLNGSFNCAVEHAGDRSSLWGRKHRVAGAATGVPPLVSDTKRAAELAR